MNIDYDFYWTTPQGVTAISHGTITEEELEELVERKERENHSGDSELESISFTDVKM